MSKHETSLRGKILVCRTPGGREVGRVAAGASNAAAYIDTLGSIHPKMQVVIETDDTGAFDLLARR